MNCCSSATDSIVGNKRESQEVHSSNASTSSTKRKCSKTTPRPSIQDFTQFILAFTKAHNQGNAGQIIEMLQERFHPKFERVSYRIELPSRKVIEDTKIQSFGIKSYMKYLDFLSKVIPDSVFYVGRPFTMANYKKKRNLYVVQCNYSYRGTFIALQNDASSVAVANSFAGTTMSPPLSSSTSAFPATTTAETTTPQLTSQMLNMHRNMNVSAVEMMMISKCGSTDSIGTQGSAMSITPSLSTNVDMGSTSSDAYQQNSHELDLSTHSNSDMPSRLREGPLSSGEEENDQDEAEGGGGGGVGNGGVDFSVVFGDGDELTNLEFVCFDDFDFMDDEHFESLALPDNALVPILKTTPTATNSTATSSVSESNNGQLLLPPPPQSNNAVVDSPISNRSVGSGSGSASSMGEYATVCAPIDSLTSTELQNSAMFLLNHTLPSNSGSNESTSSTTSIHNTDESRSGPISSVPFNLSGKLSFYVNKTTHKIVRMEYVYSA